MAADNELDAYFEVCRGTFKDRPETHRIDLYTEHADRERESPGHFYRLAKACMDGGSVALWRRGVDLVLLLTHATVSSIEDRREALRWLGDWSAW